jgi:hypothetical protein
LLQWLIASFAWFYKNAFSDPPLGDLKDWRFDWLKKAPYDLGENILEIFCILS